MATPSLFGTGTVTNELRGGLSELSATQRVIATRVAAAHAASATAGFAGQLDSAMQTTDQDVMRDMASLADTELRYETTASLLQKSYSDLRSAITSNG